MTAVIITFPHLLFIIPMLLVSCHKKKEENRVTSSDYVLDKGDPRLPSSDSDSRKNIESKAFIATEEMLFEETPWVELTEAEGNELIRIIRRGEGRGREMIEKGLLPKGEILECRFALRIQFQSHVEKYAFDERIRFRNRSIFLSEQEKVWLKALLMKYL